MGGQEGDDVVCSIVTPIDSSNIGFQLLKKHGWREGTGLGISEQGRLEPVQTYLQINKRGLGTDNAIRCEICNLDCNSKDVLDRHMLGKKHRRNLQMQIVSTDPVPNTSETVPNKSLGQIITGDSAVIVGRKLEKKKLKLLENGVPVDSMMFCGLCNVACNSQAVFNKHLSGRKHAAKISEQLKDTIGTLASTATPGTTTITGPTENLEASGGKLVDLHNPKRKADPSHASEEDIETKRRKIVEGGAAADAVRVCSVCNVVCNSPLVFKYHLSGQKHAEMVKKQAEDGSTTSGAQDQVVTAA